MVDLRPSIRAIQRTLALRAPVTGAVIVTTPKDIALIDARKGLKNFEKVLLWTWIFGKTWLVDYG